MLEADGTFAMSDMPKWVIHGDSSRSKSSETVSCAGTWTLFPDTQNISLTGDGADCGGSLFTSGRAGEMTVAFGIDGASDDPRCFELVESGSDLEPRNPEECLTY